MGRFILLIVLFAYYGRRESLVTGSLRAKRSNTGRIPIRQKGGPPRLAEWRELRCRDTSYRSISPKTISSDPMIADTSANMWPRVRKSMACRCANEGARILHLYGRLLPSDTR